MSPTRAITAIAAAVAAALVGGLCPMLAMPASAAPAHSIRIGTSVQGRPITVIERGNPLGVRTMLVVGNIHGNESAGTAVTRRLLTQPLPTDLRLFILPTLNPDGLARGTRGNAHGVDLNRNFPANWHRLVGWQYSGPGPASEPETRALMGFIKKYQPQITMIYHQNLQLIDPNGANRSIGRKYAAAVGLRYTPATGGIYTGGACDWINGTVRGATAFTIELGSGSLGAAATWRHTSAVLRAGAPRASEMNPFGRFESATAAIGAIKVGGWALDPDNKALAFAIRSTVDGKPGPRFATGTVARPDIAKKYSAGPRAGFRVSIPISKPGVHRVCLTAVNFGQGTSSRSLGCRSVRVTTTVAMMNPTGHLDSVQVTDQAVGTVSATGWASDPDQPTANVTVQVVVDGAVAWSGPTAVARPDVAAAKKVGPTAGFAATLTLPVGAHHVCAVALNVGMGTGNTNLGCTDVTVEAQ